jgi:hypothetical protein
VLGVDWLPFLGVLIRLPMAIWLVATGTSGVDPDRLNIAERVARTVLGIALLTPFVPIQVGAFVIGGGLVAFHILQRRRRATVAA